MPRRGRAAPAAAPTTLWSFLGIPQAFQRLNGSMVNRLGNNPGMESTGPLKRIADPANLQSQNPAIQAAAKIKQDQDLAPQKIKAIKYLATVGCSCYPNVKEALVASLDDCSEDVRYEAALALCHAAGNPCKQCEKNGCCNALVMSSSRNWLTDRTIEPRLLYSLLSLLVSILRSNPFTRPICKKKKFPSVLLNGFLQ